MNFDRSPKCARFRQVYAEPVEGDVTIISTLPGPHQYSHACIYDGMRTWHSDFIQRSMYHSPRYRELHSAFKFYRHN